MQHFLHHLAPRGTAGFVLANGSMSSNQSGEGEIRKNIIEAGLVDCIIALPGQLFRSTQIPACLWFLSQGGAQRPGPAGRDIVHRRPQAGVHAGPHPPGTCPPRTSPASSDTYHAWLGGGDGIGDYADVSGFCKSAAWEEIRRHGHVLTPGRYVGAEPQPDDGEPFQDKMGRLAAQWREQQAEAARLDAAIAENLENLGFA